MKRLRHLLTLALALMLSIGAWAQGSVTVQQDANLNWGFTMPGYDALMHVDYYPATLTLAVNNNGWGSVQYVPAEAPVVWRNGEVTFSGTTITGGDITSTCGAVNSSFFTLGGGGFFTHANKRISKVEVYAGNASVMGGTGWNATTNKAVWTGLATDTVRFTGQVNNVDSIVFTLADPNVVDNGNGTYAVIPGTVVTFIAQPSLGYYFSNWGGLNTNDTLLFTMGFGDTTITANFAQNPLLTLSGNEGGSVTLDGMTTRDSALYNIVIYSETQNITAYPHQKVINFWDNVSSVFGGNDDVSIAQTGQKQVTITVNRGFSGNITVGAVVVLEDEGGALSSQYITISGTPAGSIHDVEFPEGVTAGTAENTYRVLPGTEVSVIATPDSAHYFVNWNNGAAVNSNTAATTFTMGFGDTTLTANFAAKPILTLAVNDAEQGLLLIRNERPKSSLAVGDTLRPGDYITGISSILFEGNVLYNGEIHAFYNNGYGCGNVLLDYNCELSFFNGSYILRPAIDADHPGNAWVVNNITNNDIILSSTIASSQPIVNNVTSSGTFAPGTDVTIVALPADNHHLQSWSNGYNSTSTTQTITMGTADSSVTAIFDLNPFQVAARANRAVGGTVSASFSSYPEGNALSVADSSSISFEANPHLPITLTATPAEGFHFTCWTSAAGDTLGTGITLSVTDDADVVAVFDINTYTVTLAANNGQMGSVAIDSLVAPANNIGDITLYESNQTTTYNAPTNTAAYSVFTRSQYIIPAADLAAIPAGTSITGLKYYVRKQGTTFPFTTPVPVDVYMAEVESATYTSSSPYPIAKDTSTMVHQGTLSVVDAGEQGEMTIEFSQPYIYNGGDLVIGMENSEKSTTYSATLSFYGTYFNNVRCLVYGASPTYENLGRSWSYYRPMTTLSYVGNSVTDNGDGTYTVAHGTQLTLKATANDGSHVAAWSNNAEVNSRTEATQTLTVTGDTNITANFAQNPLLTLASNQGGTMKLVADSVISYTPAEMQIGDGTGTTYYFPIDNYFNYSCTEQIYTADEIGSAGTITSISFYYNNGVAYTASNVTMYLKHVTRSAFASSADCEPISATDIVWTGSIAPTEAGWYTFTLDTPFEYNGTDNLLVAFYDPTSGYPGTSYTWRQTESPNSAHMALRYYSDSANPDPYNLSGYNGSKTWYTYRANIKIGIEISSMTTPGVVKLTDSTYNVLPGTTVSVTATPDSAHYFVNWNNDAAVNSNTADTTTLTMGFNDTTVTANFAAKPVLTLAQNESDWGSVTLDLAAISSSSSGESTEVTIGDGTSTTYVTPYNSLWGYSFVESLYTAEEIGTAGTITSVSYNLNSSESQTNDFVIYMKNVSLDTFASDTNYVPVTDADIVYSGSVTFNNGWTTITLGTPFEYDGTSNLMIGMHEFTPGYSTRYFYCTDTAGKVLSYHSDSDNPNPYNLGSYTGSKYVKSNRADIKLGITPAATAIVALTDSTYRVDYGTEVTLNAEATEMHHVQGWQNQGGNAMDTATYSNYAIYAASDSLFPAKSSLTFTVTGDTTAMAMFGINSYDLTAQVANTDDVRGTVSAAYTDVQGVSQTAADSDSLTVTAQGASTTTLTATPSWGYHFVGWLNAGGDTVSTSNPLGVTSSVDTALVALFDTTHAELAWDTNAFTGYTFIDFNNWKPTLDNPHSVNVRYGCVETGLAIDAATGLIGTVGSYGHTVPATGSWHIYAVHDLSQEYFYDSVVYTLTVEQGVTVALQKNFVNRGTTTFPDYSTTGTLTTQYLSNIMAVVGQGQTIRVDAEPATGYHFTEWRTGSTSTGYTFVSNDVLYTFTVPNTIATGIQAVFDTNIYNVVAVADTDNRAVIGSGLAMGTAAATGRHMHFLNDTLTATESYGYTFAGWVDNNGDTVSTDNPFIFSPVSDTTLTAVYTVNNFAVTALSADSTLGGVTGTDSIAYLAPDTLIATPVYGHRFTHWSNEAGDTIGTTDTLVITVLSDTTLTAHFVIDQFIIAAVSNDTNMGYAYGTDTVDFMDTVTLTATPLYGYHFVNWTEADSVYATADSIEVVATADRTLTANFAINTYLLTLAADADSMGVMSVALADTGSAGHPAGSGQLTICDGTVTNGNVPAYGFYADAYLKAEMVYPASMLTDMPAGTEISKMTFYAADPATDPWTSTWQVFLSEVADTTINAFAGPGTVVYEGLLNGTGSEMTINFTTPYTYNGGNLLVGVYNITTGNYKSVYWTGVTSNGSSVQNYSYSGLNSIDPTQRNFLPKVTFDYAMEAADPVPPSGSFVAGSEPNTYIVEHGSELVITATANASYHMTGWSNGVEVNSLTTATQTVTIVSDSAITATFGVNPVLTLADTTNGTVAVSGDLPDFAIDNQDGSYSVLPGTAMSLVATPDSGYHVTGWSNGVEVNSLTAATQTVTVDSDTTISATFGVNPVVTLAANGNGTVAPSTLPAFAIDNHDGTYSVLPGTELNFIATPDTHYYMTRWDDIDSMVNSNRAVTRTETINADTTFTANFAHKPYMTIAALPDTIKGTVTVEGSGTVGVENMFDNLVDVIAASSGWQYGVATDGQYIYTSSWSTSINDGYIFHQYDQAGNLIDNFNIAGVVLCRDMTSDGQYIYGANGETVYVMDLAAHTLVNTIQFSGAGTIRHISYDPVRDAFWVGNWSNLMLYSRTGSFIQNGPSVNNSVSGTAFYQDGEDHLILLCQPNGNAVVYDYNINQNTITQLFDITSAVGVDGSSGGSFIGYLNGTLYWLGDTQNTPNHIAVYALGKGGVYALNDSTYIVDYGATVTVNATSADSNAYYVLSWNNGVQVNHPFLAMQEVVVTTDTAISATFADNPVLTLAKNEDLGWIALEGSEIGESLDLSTLTNDTVVADGTTIYGTLANNVKVSIADGATVYLDGVTINGVSNIVYSWAGLTCLGDATIILDHDNSIQGFYENYPGIYVPEGSTLTIQGRGTLTATGSVYGAGIGGGLENSCGNIVIAGGTIVATGGSGSAAIGSGNNASCGTITITGGNVTANCGEYAAGIGSGMMGSCGAITIADSVTVVTSDAGVNANSIGAGFGGTVASVTIGTTTGAQTQNPYTYEGNGNGWTYGGLPDGVTNNHDGTYTIRYGVTVNVIAKADEHHHVESWSNEVEVNNPSPANQYVTVTSDSTITVNFSIDHHAILAVMANDIMGETFGSDTVDYLDTVTLYATPATGYHFVEWTEADSLYSTSDTIVVVAIHDRTFTAHMDTNIYNVQIAVASANTGMGTVADTPDSVKHFLSASYEATPATGYHFAGWVNAANETVSTDNPVTVSPVSDTVLYATFDTNTYVLTVLAADTATGSVSGSDSAALHFVDYTITATPATCYQFVAWNDGTTDNPRTVTLTSDSTFTAQFAYIARAGEETLVVCDSVTWNDSTYTVSGDYSKVLQTSETCDSTATLHLTVKYSTSSLNTAVACESYTWHNVTYTTSTLAHYDTINAVGCDSVANLDLTINYNTSSEETVVTCDSVYVWNGITYVSSTVGTWHTTDGNGCDSTATLYLTLNNNFTGVDNVTACGSYTWVDGVTYTESTDTPTYVFQMVNGCDSTVTLALTISNAINTVETVTACDSYEWHDSTYTASTDAATWTGQSAAGCDSTVTLHLTVNNSVEHSFDAATCSYYIWDGSYYNETGSYTKHYTAVNGCDSTVTMNLTVSQTTNVAISDTACGTYTWNGVNYTASGAYTQNFISSTGCDSTVTLTLTLNPSVNVTVMATACDTFVWHGVTYTETPAEDPTWTTTGSNGCDSITTLHLVIAHSDNNVDSVTACGSYTWIDGITYTASTNEPSYTITGENCDVTVTLHLTINNGVEYSFNATTCSYYIWDGNYYNETGSYTKHYTAANGCDSTATLNLTVGQQTTVAINETACGSYTWNGTTYTGSGSYTQHFTGSNNCDSTVTLTLTINQPIAATETVMACDSFAWHGVTYTATPAVAPTFTATGSNGCDSVTTLNLTVAYSNSAIETVTACDSLLWHGTVYTADNNTATYSTTNAAGCDSTVTLNLTVNSSVASSFDTAACNYYVWDGSYYAQSGSYTKHYTAANGCDSAATLHLTVNHAVTATVRDTACDSYTWNGVTYAASGAYTQILTGSTGCDSTVTLVLTINRSNNSIETVTACDSYTWHGTTYTASNSSATYSTTNAAGCDSTVTLHLTVNYSTASDEIVTACDSYTWHGTTYTASTNTATYTTTNAAGCDNVVTLNLTIGYSNSSTETVTACDNYTWHGTVYTASNNTATYTATNADGCDSTVTLNLTVNHSTASTETVTACNAFFWHDSVYTASTTATYTTVNAAGCDSVTTLHLTINNCSTTEITVCDSYTWHGTVYTLSGTYYDGNDTLVLTVNYSTSAIETVTACNAFFWHDSVYTASTTATYTTVNAAGCDSVTTLHLTINNCSTTEITVCDSYTWHGTVYTLSGTYYDGNDTLVLTVNYSTSAIETVTACNSYEWHGTTYTTSTNTPTWTTTNAVGCDSVVTLNLTIIHCSTSEITACDSYTWHGTVYTEGGTYYDGNDTLILTLHYSTTGDTTAMACDEFDWYEHTGLTVGSDNLTHLFTGANQWGCDSTVTLHLTVNYSHDTAFFMQAEGSIVWNGETFTESGVYVRTIQTVNGCDSVVTLTLAILPEGTPIPTIYNVMDVVIAVNHNEEGQEDVHYAWYRWYRNGALVLEGADIDSYSEGGSRLNGTYYLEVATSDSREFWVRSNELVIGDAAIDDVEGDISFSLSPNPAVYGQQVTVKVNASDSDLQGAELCVYDLQGRLVVKPVAVTRGIEATLNTGVYMVRITLKDGRSAVRRLVVR